MKETKKISFSATELIIVIAIAVVLIAVLVPTFISLANNKKMSEQNGQQIADLSAKLDEQKPFTTEELEAKIADMIVGIKIPEGVKAEDVSKAITDAIAGLELPDGEVLSAEEVKAIVDAAIAGIEIPEAGLSAEDVEKIVADAIAGIEMPEAGLSAAEVEQIINNALANLDTGLSELEVKALIAEAIAGVDAGVSAEEVAAAIEEALAKLDTGLTAEEVKALIEETLEKYNLLPLEGTIQKGGEITLTRDVVMEDWFGLTEDVALDLDGHVLTLDPAFCMDMWSNVVIENGVIVSNGGNQLYVTRTGNLTLKNVTIIHEDATSPAVINRGTLVIDGCKFVNKANHNNMILSNGMTFSDGTPDQYANMTISNTVFEGDFVANICVINNVCGTITFGENVVINAERTGSNMFADPIVRSDDTLKGSVTINGEVVTFN